MVALALKVTKALIARILFAAHNIITIWRLYADGKNMYFMLFALAPVCLFLEAAVTILWRHGDEYKWLCPSIFIFLCGSVPPIWFLEFSATDYYVNNQTFMRNDDERLFIQEKDGFELKLPTLPRETWLQLVEQSLLVVLILGRWLLPKGQITRDELSQLLLAYVAISADIVELFNMFTEDKVRGSVKLSFITLAVWSVSLIQFILVITTVKGQKARYCWSSSRLNEYEDVNMSSLYASPNKRKNKTCLEKFTDVSVWGILSTVILQDGPFLALRIYLIFWENVTSYTMFFFISKNSLIIMVQLYRLMVICCDSPNVNSGPKYSYVSSNEMAEKFYLLQQNGSFNGSNLATPKKKVSNGLSSSRIADWKDL